MAGDIPGFSDLCSQTAEQSLETANRDLGWDLLCRGTPGVWGHWCSGVLDVFASFQSPAERVIVPVSSPLPVCRAVY